LEGKKKGNQGRVSGREEKNKKREGKRRGGKEVNHQVKEEKIKCTALWEGKGSMGGF